MPRIPDDERRIRHVAQIRDLAVYLGWRGSEFVAKADVEREIPTPAIVVLNEERKQGLPVAAIRVYQSGQGHVHA